MLAPGGLCAIVLPDGELFEGNSKWSINFRKWLYKNVNIHNPVGEPVRLKDDINSQKLPTVDGTKNTKNKMFMFAYNQCRPECCPSTYSCDKGCVCTTKQQRKFINSRGSNRIPTYPGI